MGLVIWNLWVFEIMTVLHDWPITKMNISITSSSDTPSSGTLPICLSLRVRVPTLGVTRPLQPSGLLRVVDGLPGQLANCKTNVH